MLGDCDLTATPDGKKTMFVLGKKIESDESSSHFENSNQSYYMVQKYLCNLTCIWRTRVEWSRLRLRHLLNLTVKLRCTGLVELHLLFQSTSSDGVKHSQYSNSVTVSSVLRHVEGDLDVTHCTQVVDFVWANIGDDGDQVGGITKVTIVEE